MKALPTCGRTVVVALAVFVAAVGALAQTQPAKDLVKPLLNFESGKADPFTGAKTTSQNAPEGKYALLIEKNATWDVAQDWTGWDYFKFDVFNPSAEPTKLYVMIRDVDSKGYWDRVNYYTVVPPGKCTIAIPTDVYVGEQFRPGRPLIKAKVASMYFEPETLIVLDNIRLERLGTEEVLFGGLRAFDFGLATSPLMPGYKAVTAADTYKEGAGYGFSSKTGWTQSMDGFQPDALFRDYVATSGASFRVDLPNGKYHVIINLDCVGENWGGVPSYAFRKASVNGKDILDETMTFDQFRKRYFRNADREDVPGMDTFAQYVEKMCDVRQFDLDVTDGKAIFDFKADGRLAIALSALVIYPADKADAGKKFWDWTTKVRRTQFESSFRQAMPVPVGAKPPAQGYVVFSRGMNLVNAFDGPRPEDAIGPDGLSLTIARGEESAISLALQPGSDLGEIAVSVSEFVGPGGAKIDAKTFRPGWVDYRIRRVTSDGTVYSVLPRYWHSGTAPAAKVTRNFWVRTRLSDNAAPGKYTGKVTVKPAKGDPKDIPVTITVLLVSLDPVKDLAVGPWGSEIALPWSEGGEKNVAWQEAIFSKVLAALQEHGFTTLTGLPHIVGKAADGKIELDFTRSDKEMKALREHGFIMVGSYGLNGFVYSTQGAPDGGPDEAIAKKAGFADMESFLKALYGAIEEHAAANDWLPIAWSMCDEPSGPAAAKAAVNAALHAKVARDLKLKYNTFVGCTSLASSDPKDEHFDLVKSLPIASLNLHDEGGIKLIHEAGHKFSFYNGGNRWTFGRYMKALQAHYGLMFRATWHFRDVYGDPYYDLDARSQDFVAFYNADAAGNLVPSMDLLADLLPGLNDYRYLSTLERLLKEKADSPAAAAARGVYEAQIKLVPGTDREAPKDPAKYTSDRKAVVDAIQSLLSEK